jgi:GNAT superfamily N-acetyltransferase
VDDAELTERMWNSFWAFTRVVGPGSPGGSVFEREGVIAAVIPAVPERSVFNGVLYRDAEALAEALPELERAYDEAGVLAWTVWVHPGDARAREALESAGHVLDAMPIAMGLPLDELREQSLEAPWRKTDDISELAPVAAPPFHWKPEMIREGYGGLVEAGAPMYLASQDGADAASVIIFDHDGDALAWSVATLEAARGRGLAGVLLAQALVHARERGCTTGTLQSTAMGRSVYERLGYRDLGTLEMWERRKPG